MKLSRFVTATKTCPSNNHNDTSQDFSDKYNSKHLWLFKQ